MFKFRGPPLEGMHPKHPIADRRAEVLGAGSSFKITREMKLVRDGWGPPSVSEES